jgi:hypothetical protein
LSPPWLLLNVLGVDTSSLRSGSEPAVTSVEAAERAADREDVDVTALTH